MAHEASFDDVRRWIGEFGPRATLVSVTEARSPHVGSALISIAGDRLTADVGTTTRSNVLANPALCLVWQPSGDGEYQLLIDGTVANVGEPDADQLSRIEIAVAGGIMHRLAGLPDGAPSCRKLSEPSG